VALKTQGVTDQDGDDDKAPRYSGVYSFTWSPTAHELLFVSESDIYRWKPGAKEPARLTRTRGRMVVMGVFDKPAPLDLTDLVFREKTVLGSMSGYGYFDESIAMMTDKRFRGENLITGRIQLDDLVEGGLRALLTEKGKHVKIIVSPRPA